MRNDGDVPKIDGRRARRLHTEAELVRAVGELLTEGGVAAVGINAIAERAQVDKVLIYRYFGDLDGLLERYGESGDFWPTLDEVLGPDRDALRLELPEMARTILGRYAHALRSRPITLELLAWECVERSPLTRALEAARERWSDALFAEVRATGAPLTPPVLTTLAMMSAAINYLAVRGREIAVFSGLPVGSDAGWHAIDDAIEQAIRGLTSAPAATPKKAATPQKKKTHRRTT